VASLEQVLTAQLHLHNVVLAGTRNLFPLDLIMRAMLVAAPFWPDCERRWILRGREGGVAVGWGFVTVTLAVGGRRWEGLCKTTTRGGFVCASLFRAAAV
jgi:hypothetical protein